MQVMSHTQKAPEFTEGCFLFDCFCDLSFNAPAAPEAENRYINKSAHNACKRIDKYVAGGCVTSDNGELMYFVDGTIGNAENNRIKNESEIREFSWM